MRKAMRSGMGVPLVGVEAAIAARIAGSSQHVVEVAVNGGCGRLLVAGHHGLRLPRHAGGRWSG
jgi:hypothetical protein